MEPRNRIRGREVIPSEMLREGFTSQWSPETGFGEGARVASACAARVSKVLFERCLFDAVASPLHGQLDRWKSFLAADFEAASGAACGCATGPLAPWMGPLDFIHSSLLGRVAGVGSCRARRVFREPVACLNLNITNLPRAGKGHDPAWSEDEGTARRRLVGATE